MPSSARIAPTDAVPASPPPVTRLKIQRPDQISTASAAVLRSSLAQDPELRPAVVARARALVADPAYPPVGVLRRVAEQILAAPDLSENDA